MVDQITIKGYKFTMLVIIDEVFLRLYEKYVALKEKDEM